MSPEQRKAVGPAPSPVIKIVAGYAIGGTLWILLSDWLVGVIRLPAGLEAWEQSAKGLLFIGFTALLLLVILRRNWHARVVVERRLRQAERLEAIGQLAGGIAHDFNNLLTAITGYTNLLMRRDDLPEAVRHDVAQIGSAGDKAAVLTRQLLAYSRRQDLEMRVVHLNIVVGGLQRILRRVIRENIELVVNLDSDLGWIEADSGQLEQVLMNLAVNASDAMPEGGILTIETRNEVLDEDALSQWDTEPGRYVSLIVSDTGCGMDEKTAAHAFDPFFTTKAEGQGTGLGLASVYGIVKQHRGAIWLTTEQWKGSTFRICLPMVDKPGDIPVRRAPLEAEKPACRSGRILLVEDQYAVRETAARTLTACGYLVTEAENPDKAMAAVTEPGPAFDLLITDIVMPRGTGTQLAARLRHNDPGLKVLYISGYSEQLATGRKLSPGEAFLTKPFSPRDLEQKVAELMDRIVKQPVVEG